MAEYRINGYGLYLGAGIIPDSDRTTANSFEKPADMADVFSHEWDDGFIEYDLSAPVKYKPRLFIIKGRLIADSIESYKLGRDTLNFLLFQNYVTLEQVDLGIKANARLKNGANTWSRRTNLTDSKIIVDVEFQFDEVLQEVPFKNGGGERIIYLTDSQGRFYNTQTNNYISI